jgi:hypothetical protein
MLLSNLRWRDASIAGSGFRGISEIWRLADIYTGAMMLLEEAALPAI